jgi:hypothetical protein
MCLSHLIYTVRPRLIHTFHAMPCSEQSILLKATAQHACRKMACGLPARIRLLPATTRSSTKVVIRSIPISDAGGQCETKQHSTWTRKRMVAAHYKKNDLLNCWTSSSDISGYHADFHEGHGTIGAWQGRGMAWARHAKCKSAFIVQTSPGAHPASVQWVLGLLPWSRVARVWLW